MKYLNNNLLKTIIVFLGLIIALLNSSFGDSSDLIYVKTEIYAITPDTIPFDTIKVVAINSNGDSATVVISGADSITYLHSDLLINYIEDGIPEVYILGEADSSVTIEELLGDSLFIVQQDSTFITEFQYLDSVIVDTTTTVLVSTDTIYVRTDTIAYFIGTDTGAYYIPKNENTVYKVEKADNAQLVDSANTTLGKLILPLVHSKGIIITPQGGSENSSDVPKDLFGIGLEGMFNPRHISEEDVIPEPPGTWVPNPDAWTWMADLKPGSLRFPGGESGKFMHLLPYRDLDIDGIPDPIKGYGYDIEEMIRFYDITPAQGDPAAPTGPYPETYGVEMTNTNVNETFIDAGGSSVPVTMAAILADLADDNCISCAYWMDTRYTTQLLDYYKKYTQQEALPDASATYDPAYINQFVDFINFIQTQNSNYSIDIYLDLNIISQTPSEARAIVDYLRDGDINGVTDITVAGVELSNEVYFNWARDLAGFALFNDYWAYVTGDVTWGDYTNDLGVLTHFTTITVDNPVSYAEYVMRPELYDNTATTYDPSHDFFAALKASPPVNIGLPAENPNGSDLVYGPDESDDYLLGGSDAWNVQLRSHYDDMFSPGVPSFDAVILHNYFQGSKYKDLILNNLCPKYPTYPGWSTPPFCLYSGICDPYGEWRYDVNDFRLEDAFNEFLGLTDPPPAWDAVVNLSDLFKGDPIDPDAGLPGYFNLLKEGINDLDAYGLQFGAGYDNDKQLWATEYNNKPTTSNMTNQESALMDIFLNNYPDGLLLFEWSLFNIRINSNALYHKDFFTASHLHAYAGGGGSCLLTIADCGDFKSFVNPSGVPSPIDPDPYKVPGPEPDENLYLRRTSYWSMKLISEINKQDLYYLHSNYLMPTGNPNVPPTLFRDPGFDYIVLFISNMKEGPQYITINPSSIAPYIFPAFLGFDDYVTINEVQVDRNYMSSGMSNMFDINTCYNCVKDLDIISDNPHPYDIYGITPTFNRPVEYLADIPDGIRFYMDGNSFGYVTIPILKIPERAGQTNQENKSDLIEIAPNPTNSSIKFWSDEPGVLNNDDYKITITSSTGQVMIEGNWKVYEDIDVTSLPSGIYFVNISTTGIPVTIKKTNQIILKVFIAFILFGIRISIIVAQTPSIEWQHCIGGSDGEDAISILQTTDSGYAVIGLGSSFDGDGIGTNGFGDYWLVRLNQDGSIRWSSIYGGSESDIPRCLIQKQDGGFLIVGTTLSNDGDVIFNHGYYDMWIICVNDTGEIEWQQSLGGSSFDFAYSIQQTFDGGFIVVGSSESLGGDVSNHHGPVGQEPDFWVVKLNNIGDIEWEHSYGGLEAEEATSVIQMADSGYVIAGYTTSNDGDVSGLHGMVGFYSDFWVIRIDSLGNLIWQHCLGGTGDEIAFAITKTSADKCLITGIAHSSDGDVTWEHPGDELWVAQLETSGEIDWEQTYGGDNDDRGYGIISNSESDYYVIGTTKSYDEVTNWHGYIDYWLLNIDTIGNIISETCYGGSEQEGSPYFLDLIDLKKTIDGGYIFAGSTQSNDGDASGLHNAVGLGGDYWIVKLCNPNNEVWYYLDADSDGFGDSEISLKSCVIQEGYVTDSTDCDDADPDIYPGATEELNGLDDDCDGWNDDGLAIDVNHSREIKIYPNPTEGTLTVVSEKADLSNLRLTNLFGQKCSFTAINSEFGTFVIDLAGLQSGIYYLTILGEVNTRFQILKL